VSLLEKDIITMKGVSYEWVVMTCLALFVAGCVNADTLSVPFP